MKYNEFFLEYDLWIDLTIYNILRYLNILNYLNVKNSYNSICMSEKRNQNRNKFYCLRKNDARNFSVM